MSDAHALVMDFMSFQNLALYNRIQQFELDQPHAALPFSKRLAKTNQWSAHAFRTTAIASTHDPVEKAPHVYCQDHL